MIPLPSLSPNMSRQEQSSATAGGTLYDQAYKIFNAAPSFPAFAGSGSALTIPPALLWLAAGLAGLYLWRR